jgi:hypothetical protein
MDIIAKIINYALGGIFILGGILILSGVFAQYLPDKRISGIFGFLVILWGIFRIVINYSKQKGKNDEDE